MAKPTQKLTSQSRSDCGLFFVLGLVTHPFLTAFAWQLHSSWVGAVGTGQADIHAAQRHTAHGTVQARALVFAAALEGLSTPVHHASEDTGGPIPGCREKRGFVHDNCQETKTARHLPTNKKGAKLIAFGVSAAGSLGIPPTSNLGSRRTAETSMAARQQFNR